VVAGSFFGNPKPPVWVANLRATETAAVVSRGKEHTVTWRELEGADRARAWSTMNEVWPNYARYEQRAGRTLPVFHLVPA
jgi:deazaflavin-dependent oxidoreductase (nitroreductase family)